MRKKTFSEEQIALALREAEMGTPMTEVCRNRRLHVLLRREGWKVNHKLVYRIYREEELEVRTKKRRKRASALRVVCRRRRVRTRDGAWILYPIACTMGGDSGC